MSVISNFLSYLFNPSPGKEFGFYLPMIILSLLLIVGSIIFHFYYQAKKREDFAFKRYFKHTSTQLLTMGVIFLLLTGLRYENIVYFAMRFWLYLTLLIFLYLVYRNLRKYFTSYQKEKENLQNRPVAKQSESKYTTSKR